MALLIEQVVAVQKCGGDASTLFALPQLNPMARGRVCLHDTAYMEDLILLCGGVCDVYSGLSPGKDWALNLF